MAGRTIGMTKNFKAGAAVPRHRIVKFGAADDVVLTGAASTDAVFGVSSEIDSAQDEPCDVHLSGIPDVTYGGNVARGDLLTSDASGRAITAAPATGVNARIIGTAMVSGVLGDIGAVHLSPGRIQG